MARPTAPLFRHQSNVLSDPIVELCLELVVVDVRRRRRALPPEVVVALPLLKSDFDRRAAGDGAEVVQVGEDVEAERDGVAAQRLDAGAHLDVVDAVVGGEGITVRQPVLGGRVRVAEDDGWQPGHGVVEMRHAILDARLVRHEGRELGVAHARAAVVDDVHLQPLLPRVGRAQRADGRAEGVARKHDVVRWVGGLRGLHSAQHGPGDLIPGRGEAGVDLAPEYEWAVLQEELETGF